MEIQNIITIFAALVVYLVYRLEKHNKKKEAAGILLMEIRFAEKTLESLSNHPIELNPILTVLPSNNWINYSNLFLNDFDNDQLDEINKFYNCCIAIDKSLDVISLNNQLCSKTSAICQSICNIALKHLDNKDDFENAKKNFIEIYLNDPTIFCLKAPIETIQHQSQKAKRISTTPIGLKLKEIAKYNILQKLLSPNFSMITKSSWIL